MKNNFFDSKIVAAMLIMVFFPIAALTYLFWPSITDLGFDPFGNAKVTIKRLMPESAAAIKPGYTLRPERNDRKLIHIDKLAVGTPTELGTPVSFSMTNEGDHNDFPNIKILFNDAAGKTVRDHIFTPGDYQHADKFDVEEVTFQVGQNPGETGIVVQPYYSDGADD
jgi:hypothetical protein